MKSRVHGGSIGSSPNATASYSSAELSLKKRWLYLLPAVFVTYSLAYLDRANYGFGAAAGLATTLHITGQKSSLLSALFFLGYFAFQVPGAIFARKHSASWLVFSALIAWGGLAALTGILRQFWMLALDRFLLGIAESCIFPAMLLLLTRWFTRTERSRANSFLILGNPVTVIWMSAITGFLIQAYGWQKTFILEGIPSILWAVVWIIFVRDKPSEARWMTPEAAKLLEERLAQEQLSVPPVGAVREALLRPDVLLLAVQYFLWSLGVYGFVLWLPTILRQGGSLSIANTGLFSACPYIAAVVMMLIVSQVSDKTQKRQSLIWPLLLVSALALFGSFVFAQRSFTVAFACLIVGGGCMYAPYGPFFAIVPERVPRNVVAEVLAFINSSGALGGFFGSYFVGWLQATTGNSRAGYLLMSLSLACSAVLLLFLKESRKPEVVLVPEVHAKP
jgi:sugar phosphate permease